MLNLSVRPILIEIIDYVYSYDRYEDIRLGLEEFYDYHPNALSQNFFIGVLIGNSTRIIWEAQGVLTDNANDDVLNNRLILTALEIIIRGVE